MEQKDVSVKTEEEVEQKPQLSLFKRQIANVLSSIRLVGGIALFFFPGLNMAFLIVFFICCMTDLFDGPITRHYHTESLIGNMLDTFGDLVVYLSLAKAVILSKLVHLWTYIWIGVALTGQVAGACVAQHKWKKFYFVHAPLDKVMGAGLSLTPYALMLNFINNTVYLVILCVVITLAAIESLLVQVFSTKEMENVKSTRKVFADYRQMKRLKAAGAEDASVASEEE